MDGLNQLRTTSTVRDLQRRRARVATHQHVIEERALADQCVDVEIGRLVAEALLAMVDAAESLDRDQRSWVRAAVDYFILMKDSDHDLGSTLGLHDDADAVKFVCEVIGRPDLRIAY